MRLLIIQTDTETDRKTDIDIHVHTHTEIYITHTQTHRQTRTETCAHLLHVCNLPEVQLCAYLWDICWETWMDAGFQPNPTYPNLKLPITLWVQKEHFDQEE